MTVPTEQTPSMSSGPKYPNQQLRSVSLETHFPGQLGVYGALGEIQAAVKDTLPGLFVPNFQPGEAAALRPFQMRDPQQKRSLAIAVNQVTFVSFDYPGFDLFSAEAVPILVAALERIKPERINRVTYRYENEVGVARDDVGGLMIDQTFPGIVPAVLAGSASRAINAAFEHVWEDRGLKGARGFHGRTEEDQGLTVLKLTVFGSVDGVDLSGLPQAAADAHRVGLELFESVISDNFRKFISAAKE